MTSHVPLLQLEVPGRPVPQGSKRAMIHARSKKVVTFESNRDSLAGYRADIVEAARREILADDAELFFPLTRAVRIDVGFGFPRPKSHFYTGKRADVLREDAPQRYTKKPDTDKLLRAVFDALTAGSVLADDALIDDERGRKFYVTPGAGPVTRIAIWGDVP